MSKKILITGIAGFISSRIVKNWKGKRDKIYGIDNFSTGKRDNLLGSINKIEQIYEHDIADREAVFRTFDHVKPDVVLHLAAQPSLLASIEKPSLDIYTNVFGTMQILEASKYFEVKQFVFTSTSAVTEADQIWADQDFDSEELPKTPYGISKLAAEMYIRALLPDNHTIFRLANIYGEKQVPLGKNQVIPLAIKHMLYGDEFVVHSEGKHTRDFTYVGDVAQAFKIAVKKNITGTFNLCSGESTSVMGVLNKLREIVGWDGDWQTTDWESDDRLHVNMMNGWFTEQFKNFQFTKLDTGLKNTIDWWKKQERDNG